MTIATSISQGSDEGIALAGYPLTDLMRSATFGEIVFLLLAGRKPTTAEARLTDAILISCSDHGLNAPSAHVARASASCGVPLATAVATGIASIGTHHGGAGKACAQLLQEGLLSDEGDPSKLADHLLDTAFGQGRNIPGYGHRVYKDADPRAVLLLELAGELQLSGKHCGLAQLLEARLEARKGKRLVLNVDGAQAAILSDLGVPWNRVQPFFIIGRSLGLCTQVLEELGSSQALGYLKASPASQKYVGPDPRIWSTP
jgi:citryl-CoA lyase